jgi:hypothetical protein
MRSLTFVLSFGVLSLLFGATACSDSDPCGPENCAGCCSSTKGCVDGRDDDSCGNGGQPCTACSTGTFCQAATPSASSATTQSQSLAPSGGSCKFTTPDPTNCAPGCKAADGSCKGGNDDAACGLDGISCRECPEGTSCQAGRCTTVCNFDTCKEGCCEGNTCVEEISDAQCGNKGLKCKACQSPKSCDLAIGDCAGPASGCEDCKGCCQDDKCFDGDMAGACGKGGGACDICDPKTEQCGEGSCEPIPKCDFGNCAEGCCTAAKECIDFDKQDLDQCGREAQPCSPCSDAIACTIGFCVKDQPCFSYCTEGCCTLAGQCIGFGDQDTDQCGKEAALCVPCGESLSCLAGVCQTNPVWQIEVAQVVLTELDPDDNPWDYFPQEPPPDVYVWMGVGSASGTSDTISNTITPCWECDPAYDGTVLTAAQSELTNNSLKISVRDSDLIGYEEAGSCSMTITSAILSSGSHVVSQCGPNVSDLKILFIKQ